MVAAEEGPSMVVVGTIVHLALAPRMVQDETHARARARMTTCVYYCDKDVCLCSKMQNALHSSCIDVS